MTTPSERVLARLRELDEKAGPRVDYATMRPALVGDTLETHIECRFADGQKYAPISVTDGEDAMAGWVCDSFTIRNSLPALRALIEAAQAMRGFRPDGSRSAENYDAALAAYLVAIGGNDGQI